MYKLSRKFNQHLGLMNMLKARNFGINDRNSNFYIKITIFAK